MLKITITENIPQGEYEGVAEIINASVSMRRCVFMRIIKNGEVLSEIMATATVASGSIREREGLIPELLRG